MVVLDTVLFQHLTLTIPEITMDDQIIHCLRSLTTAIWADRSPDQKNNQLLAIKSIRAILALHARATDSAPLNQFIPPLAVTPPAVPPRVIEGAVRLRSTVSFAQKD